MPVIHVWLPDMLSDDSPVVFSREDNARAYVDAVAHSDERWAVDHAPLTCVVWACPDAAEMIRQVGGSDDACTRR